MLGWILRLKKTDLFNPSSSGGPEGMRSPVLLSPTCNSFTCLCSAYFLSAAARAVTCRRFCGND